MALFLVTRPKGAENLRNPSGLHAAIVDAADAASAIVAANALAPHLNDPFAGYDATQIAATADGGFVPAMVQGDVLGDAYSGARPGQ